MSPWTPPSAWRSTSPPARSPAPSHAGASVVGASIGEPATLVELDGLTLAVVLECLGTKSMIAREVEDALGLDRWDTVGVDAVAAIVNDLCCVGALPLTLNAYFATGAAQWYAGSRHALPRHRVAAGVPRRSVRPGWVASRRRCLVSSRPSRSTSPARPSGRVPEGPPSVAGHPPRAGRRDRRGRLERAARQRRLPRPSTRRVA